MNNEISLAKFLSRYYLLSGEDLKKITHEDIKQLIPSIRRSSFEEVKKNPMLLKSNKVLFVNDGHKTIPYYVPMNIDFDEDVTDFIMIKDKEYQEQESYDYVSMSNYELKALLNNKFNSRKNRMKAKKELEDRGLILKKKYNRCKDNKKEDYYGEY